MSADIKSTTPEAPFGTVITAMITPFNADGSLDEQGAAALAKELVDHGNDGLVINGTTGESATTRGEEKLRLLQIVVEAVGDRAHIIAGVGTNSTYHTCELAQAAAHAGADGLLVVTPYYNKPPQSGLLHHFTAVADSSELPVMLYDIPGRSGIPIETETLVQLAKHPNITALKDAKGNLAATAEVIARTDLAVYSGEDALTLPLVSVGAVGVVGVPTHLFARETGQMIAAFRAGEVDKALALHQQLLAVYTGFFRTQGTILTKAALQMLGLPAGSVRPPLVDATPAQVEQLRADMDAAGWDRGQW